MLTFCFRVYSCHAHSRRSQGWLVCVFCVICVRSATTPLPVPAGTTAPLIYAAEGLRVIVMLLLVDLGSLELFY